MNLPPSSGGGIQRFVGLLIIVASVLWIAFCGLCGYWVFYAMVTNSPVNVEMVGGTLFILAVSGCGAAAGYALFLVGRGLAK